MEKFLTRNWWKIVAIFAGLMVLGVVAFPSNTPNGVDPTKRNEDIDACKAVTDLLSKDQKTLSQNVLENRSKFDTLVTSPDAFYLVPKMIKASPRVNEMTKKIYEEIRVFLESDFADSSAKLNSFNELISSNEETIVNACSHVYKKNDH